MSAPRAHGSGLFTRGETQVLTLATLGTPREAQELDNLTPADTKRYMHHYNFPPFSTGEVKPLRGASRRDVGHGALAERALIPVIPPEDEFPLCPAAGLRSALIQRLDLDGFGLRLDSGADGHRRADQGAGGRRRHGSDQRRRALQHPDRYPGHRKTTWAIWTSKSPAPPRASPPCRWISRSRGITPEIMSKALEQARIARLAILEKMLAVIPAPRPELKPHAPRITVVQIPVDKIGAVIGPGGKMIRSIQEETGAKIDISEDGTVFIATSDGESARMAREKVEALTETAVIGRIYTGKVVRIADFGAFVEILPNMDGLVHISQLDTQRVNKVEDVVRMGDEITVMVTDIDDQGKIRLSRQAVLEGWTVEEAAEHDRGGRSGGGRSGGGRPGGNRGGGDRVAVAIADRRDAKLNPDSAADLSHSGYQSSDTSGRTNLAPATFIQYRNSQFYYQGLILLHYNFLE